MCEPRVERSLMYEVVADHVPDRSGVCTTVWRVQGSDGVMYAESRFECVARRIADVFNSEMFMPES